MTKSKRKSIPASIAKTVFHEAGYRCAVPACRQTIVYNLHHIEHVAQNGKNTVANLIVLCPNCHALYHSGVIPRGSIVEWKTMLVELNKTTLGIQRLRKDAIALWRENFPKLREEAMAEARKRVDHFLEKLGSRIQNTFTADQLGHFKKPEVQYALGPVNTKA